MYFYEANSTDLVAGFLIETLNCFITGTVDDIGSKQSGANKLSHPAWRNVEALQEALRNLDMSKMDKNWIRERMEHITGESGIPEQDGDVYKAISNGANIKKYLCYIPFFKILSKTLHLALMLKKEDEMQKRVTQNNRSINQMEVKLRVSAQIEDASLTSLIANEAERIRNEELMCLKTKHAKLIRRKKQIESKDIVAEFLDEEEKRGQVVVGVTCSEGKPLHYSTEPRQGQAKTLRRICDICKKTIEIKNGYYVCADADKCNYDCCITCFKGPK